MYKHMESQLWRLWRWDGPEEQVCCLVVSMCVENVLVGGRNLNKFKSGDVNDKCYTTVSLLRAGERTGGSILR